MSGRPVRRALYSSAMYSRERLTAICSMKAASGPRIMMAMLAMGLERPSSSRAPKKPAKRDRNMMAWASTAAKLPMRMSRFFTWPSSWARTASSSGRLRMRMMPSVTATTACSGLRPVAKAFGVSSGMMAMRGMGRPARWARFATMACSSGAWAWLTGWAP